MNAQADRTQKLAAMLRAVASQAADRSDGGVALVFATQEGALADTRLRAASGFVVADDAREMAQVLLHFGVDDIGATYDNEKVVHAAGAKTADYGSEAFLERLITEAQLVPQRTNAGYSPLGSAS